MICIVQIQPRKPVLIIDHADYTAHTRQRGLHNTDQEYSALKHLDHKLEIDNLGPSPVRGVEQCEREAVRAA